MKSTSGATGGVVALLASGELEIATWMDSRLLGHMSLPLPSRSCLPRKGNQLVEMVPYTDISNGFNTLTFLSSANRKTSILWYVAGAHLSLQLCPNGSEAADDPRVERDAIHWIKPNSVPRDEGHYTFGSTCIVFRFDQLVCHLPPARRTLSNVAR